MCGICQPFIPCKKKSNGGRRFITAFSDVGRYSKPQPSMMPDVDNTLRQIGQWRYIIATDLSNAFYQIPLSKSSMKYCGVATPFKGTRVYVRSAMGMPGSETALEELTCRILGNLLQEGIVVKIADDLYCGADSPDALLTHWHAVLESMHRCGMCLSAPKTFIAPRTTTILGWKWQMGTLSATPLRLSTLSTCSPPENVKGMRSFIGAFKVLSRVIESAAVYTSPLDASIAGKQSSDKVDWTEELKIAFLAAQKSLSTSKTIHLPRSEDALWIVCDGSVSRHGIGATLYVTRDTKPRLAGYFSAKLRARQVTWLLCEIEALAIASATKHYAPYIIQSRHSATILTDCKPQALCASV